MSTKSGSTGTPIWWVRTSTVTAGWDVEDKVGDDSVDHFEAPNTEVQSTEVPPLAVSNRSSNPLKKAIRFLIAMLLP